MGSRSQTRQQTDSRQSVETSNLNLSDFEGTGIAGSEDVEISTRIEQVDGGLIDAARNLSRDSFDTSASIASDANALAGQAIRANQDSVVSGLDFGEDVLEDVLLFGGDALDNATLASGRATEAISETARRAVDASGEFLREGFGFGGDALDAVDRSGERSAAVAEQAIDDIRGFGSDAFGFVGDIFTRAVDAVTGTAQDTNVTLAGAIGSAADATRSDSANVLNNVAKFGALAVGAIAVAFIISKAK